jgi:hypothetical protein
VPVSGRGCSGGIGSGGGDNDIGFEGSIVCMCGVCVRMCRLHNMLRNKMSGTIMLIFIFGMDRAKLFFWQSKCQTFFLAAKTTFGSWHAGTRGIHTGFNIFGSEKRLWQNSAKNKSWHDLCQK